MQSSFTDSADPIITLTLTREEMISLSCLAIGFEDYVNQLHDKGQSFCNREGENKILRLRYEISRLSNQLHANDLAYHDCE